MRARTAIFLTVAGVVAAGLLLSRQRLSHAALTAVLDNPAPTEAAMAEFLDTAQDRPKAIVQLWETGRIPQRAFALNYLVRRARDDRALWQAARPFVVAATAVADSEMQATALQLLFDNNDERRIPLAAGMLASTDPQVRVTGLMRLNAQNDRKWAATDARLLDDPDAIVRTLAAAGLKNLSGEDFGVRLAADESVIAPGITAWKKWWSDNAVHYPPESPAEKITETSPGDSFSFGLPSLAGRTENLSDYRGKVVLLNFWATWCPSCLEELQALGDLQRAHPDDLVILGVNLDGVSDGDDHDAPPDAKALADMRKEIEKAVQDSRIGYPTLLDPKGSTLGAYGAGALPVNILIGKDGTVKRRLLGGRKNAAWEAMVAEAASR